MVTFLSIIGTRPEAIKMAPVLNELRRYPDLLRSVVCVTGQHRLLLDQVLTLFAIKPDFDLNVMQPDQALSQLTADLLTGLDNVVKAANPDWILAQGDTTTALAAALVAHYRRRKFAHVEAGLRSGDKLQPFPEEVNRRLADALADLLFAPTERARQALLREGIRSEDIYVTGNTVVDALQSVLPMMADEVSRPLAALPRDRRLVLVTAHRRESLGDTLRQICLAVRDLAVMFDSERVQFVYPVHPNPNVRRPVSEILSDLPNVSVIEPLDYLSMISLMKRCSLILTDSGGIQEEAPSLGIPVLVMREVTDRPEGLEAGVARLIGTGRSHIVEEAARLLRDSDALTALTPRANPYGDGKAASRIVSVLIERSAAEG
jgi:UDP-N-acetylglucosamine 2-epimerase